MSADSGAGLFVAFFHTVTNIVREVAMKVPTIVVFSGLLSAACFGVWTGVARTEEAGVTDLVRPGACGAAIARLETALNRARANRRAAASAPESVDALLHHQPTQESVAKAEGEVQKRVETSIELARRLRFEGKRSECVAIIGKVSWRIDTPNDATIGSIGGQFLPRSVTSDNFAILSDTEATGKPSRTTKEATSARHMRTSGAYGARLGGGYAGTSRRSGIGSQDGTGWYSRGFGGTLNPGWGYGFGPNLGGSGR
jgi:hypothetical protein